MCYIIIMATQNSSSLISSVYKSRKILLELMKKQGYVIDEYAEFSINEVNSMNQNKQLDMLLEKKEPAPGTDRKNKIYIRYYLAKIIRQQNLQEIIDDLFNLEEILTKKDTLMIIVKEDMNESLTNVLKHIWEQDGILIVIQNIKRLQFNILEHILVPEPQPRVYIPSLIELHSRLLTMLEPFLYGNPISRILYKPFLGRGDIVYVIVIPNCILLFLEN